MSKLEELKKFVDFYYQTNSTIFPSIPLIAETLNVSVGRVRKITDMFIDCNFLYRDNKKIIVFLTKRNFNSDFKIHEDDKYYVFSGESFQIKLNKFELSLFQADFDVNASYTIQQLIYWLFCFTEHFHTKVGINISFHDNKLWYKKQCYCKKVDAVLYSCSFTQNNTEINLINE